MDQWLSDWLSAAAAASRQPPADHTDQRESLDMAWDMRHGPWERMGHGSGWEWAV